MSTPTPRQRLDDLESEVQGAIAIARLARLRAFDCGRARCRAQLEVAIAALRVALDLVRVEDKRLSLTDAERRFLESATTDGHAWYWPAQSPMVKRLASRGLVDLHAKTRTERGTQQRLALVTNLGRSML